MGDFCLAPWLTAAYTGTIPVAAERFCRTNQVADFMRSRSEKLDRGLILAARKDDGGLRLNRGCLIMLSVFSWNTMPCVQLFTEAMIAKAIAHFRQPTANGLGPPGPTSPDTDHLRLGRQGR